MISPLSVCLLPAFVAVSSVRTAESGLSLTEDADRLPRKVVVSAPGNARAVIVVDRFDPKGHRFSLRRLRPGLGQRVHIDGKFAWGLEGTDRVEFPHRMIRKIEITVGDRRIALPREAFSDTYEPPSEVGAGKGRRYWLWASESKRLARLKMWASDGAGGYGVVWTVPFAGKVRRAFLYPP
jgi:hypothetical protein